MSDETSAKILIVEDNPLDAEILQLALKEAGFSREPTAVDDGIPAVQLLEGAKTEPELMPDLIVLDLNLRQMDGPEVLAHIRRTPELEKLFVAILSSYPTEVLQKRAASADAHFKKPNSLKDFYGVGRLIREEYLKWQTAGHL